MPPAEITLLLSAATVFFALIWHAATMAERLRRARRDLDELTKYAHSLNHQIVAKISEKMDDLQRQILAVTPRDQWPK